MGFSAPMLLLVLLWLLAHVHAVPIHQKRLGGVLSSQLQYLLDVDLYQVILYDSEDATLWLIADSGSRFMWAPNRQLGHDSGKYIHPFECSEHKDICKETSQEFLILFNDNTKLSGTWATVSLKGMPGSNLDTEQPFQPSKARVSFPLGLAKKFEGPSSPAYGNLGLLMVSGSDKYEGTNFLKVLHNQKIIPRYAFSFLIPGKLDKSEPMIDFGGTVPGRGHLPMVYTAITSVGDIAILPYVTVNNIYLNDKTPLEYTGQALVDTGAPFLLPSSVYSKVVLACKMKTLALYATGSGSNKCFITVEFAYSLSQPKGVVSTPTHAEVSESKKPAAAPTAGLTVLPKPVSKPKALFKQGIFKEVLVSKRTDSKTTAAGKTKASTANTAQYFRVRVPLANVNRLTRSSRVTLGTGFLQQVYTEFDYAERRIGFAEVSTVSQLLGTFSNRITNGPLMGALKGSSGRGFIGGITGYMGLLFGKS